MNWLIPLFVGMLVFWPLWPTIAMRAKRTRHGGHRGSLSGGPNVAAGADDRDRRIAELEREIAELRSINNEHRFAGSRRG